MTVGLRWRTAKRTIRESDVAMFVGVAGYVEPLFTEKSRAADAGYRGDLVPAALTHAIAEGLIQQTGALHGTGMAFMHMELDARAPVYAADTVEVLIEILESRATSRGRGVVTSRNLVVNQRGEAVLTYTAVRLIRGRPTD